MAPGLKIKLCMMSESEEWCRGDFIWFEEIDKTKNDSVSKQQQKFHRNTLYNILIYKMFVTYVINDLFLNCPI